MISTGLTTEQKRFYDENGYLLVRQFITGQEAAALRAEVHAIAERQGPTNATWSSVSGQGTKLEHSHDVQFRSAAFTRLLVDRRLTELFSSLIGPNVQLHHNKMFIKPPEKGSPFPLHQDYPFFPHTRHSMIAAILHFDDAPVEKGCVCVVPGSHKRGPVEHIERGGWHLPFEQYPLESAVPCPAQAGDVLFFSYLTIHGSGINSSDEARTTLLVQMRDPADPPLVATHE